LLAQRGINDSVTASWEFAVESAKSIRGVAVLLGKVTILAILNSTVTTVGLAVGAAHVVGSVQNSIIAIFVEVSDTVTTDRTDAAPTALRWVDTVGFVIALLKVNSVSDTITAVRQQAVLSASVGGSIAVGSSVIALLETVSEVDFTITAFEQADGRTSVKVVSVSVVALLSWIDDTVTASWQPTVGTANTRDVLVSSSEVAFLTEIDDTITTSGGAAVETAAARVSGGERSIAVSGSLIALFVDSPNDAGVGPLDSSIAALAIRELREIINDLFQKFVGWLGGGSSLKENGADEFFWDWVW